MSLLDDRPDAIGRQFIDLGSEVATTILQIIKAGWVRAQKYSDVNTSTGEVPITQRLRDGMCQALNHEWSRMRGSMIVQGGTETRSRPEVLVPDGRTDISIIWIEIVLRFGVDDPHAIIECKRIAGNNAYLCREYVKEGIDRFKNGKYAGNHSTGFMIGYLIASNAPAAVTGINNHLNRKSRNGESLQPSQLINELWAWKSCHPRTQPASAIALHHAFLSFEIA